MKYYLKDDSFTVTEGPIILFDCPLERIKHEPEMAFKMAKLIEGVWEDMFKQLQEENLQLKEQLNHDL